MNRVILLLIVSDILILSAFGLISPIFAIFLNEGIAGGSITAAGLASTIFFIVKSVTQLPLSILIDRRRDKLLFLIGGTFLIFITPIIYSLSPHVKFIFFAQAIYGLGAAMSYPAWFTLFTTHIDKKHKGLEWSIWGTGVGLGTAFSAYVGAKIAERFGFDVVFYSVAILTFLGMCLLFFLSKKYLKEVKRISHFLKMDHLKR
ncbi:MAG: MFS transporter [Candidatus Pacearchaeota archaeon]